MTVLEIRTYTLHDGTRDAFHRTFAEQAVPMMTRSGLRVVHAGPCEDDPDTYVLIRSFDSLQARAEQKGRFYGSEEWKTKLEEDVMAKIASYATVVVPAEALTQQHG